MIAAIFNRRGMPDANGEADPQSKAGSARLTALPLFSKLMRLKRQVSKTDKQMMAKSIAIICAWPTTGLSKGRRPASAVLWQVVDV